MRNRITGYVVQLDLDKRTVRLRDCPSCEGMGRLVFDGYVDPAWLRGLALAFRNEACVSGEVFEGRLRDIRVTA